MPTPPAPPPDFSDEGYTLLAVADDFLEEFKNKDDLDVDAAYDWLVKKAYEVGS